jgi:hypothetical protein
MQPTLKKGKYQHYKGNLYEVLTLARHSETEEWLVVYKMCYGDESVWVRPYEMFTESIDLEGEVVERFQYLGVL